MEIGICVLTEGYK